MRAYGNYWTLDENSNQCTSSGKYREFVEHFDFDKGASCFRFGMNGSGIEPGWYPGSLYGFFNGDRIPYRRLWNPLEYCKAEKWLDEVNDHVFIFTKKIDGRELRMYVTQPYNHVDELYENVKDWCEKHGLLYVIYDEGDAFWHRGATMALVMTKDMKDFYQDKLETWGNIVYQSN